MRKKKNKNDGINQHQDFMRLLFTDYRKLVLKKLHNRLSDLPTIEDLSQEVFLRLINNVEVLLTLEKPALVNYICQTADSIVIDWARKNASSFECLSLDEAKDYTEPSASAVELIIIDKVDAEIMPILMEQLEEIDQKLLTGYYFMDYTVKELSEIYQCTEGNVMTRMSRARKRLLHLYKMRGDDFNEQ